MGKPKLAVVPATEPLFSPELIRAISLACAPHLVDLARADINRRNWRAAHIRGDRAQPVFIPDAPKRLWR